MNSPKNPPDHENVPLVSLQSTTTSLDMESKKKHHEIPDGGFQAWMTVAGGWITLFTSFGASNSFGVFQDFYTRQGTSSASNISWIGSVQLFLLFSLGLFTGKLFDAGYFHYIHSVGMFVYLFSTFMLSLADSKQYYQLFLAQGLGVGIGVGLMMLPALAIQGHYWKKRRGMAMGIVMTGTSFGGIIYPIMMNRLLHYTSLGFGWSVRVMAFLDLGLLVIAKLIMTTNHPPTRPEVPKPNVRSIFTDKPFMIAIFGGYFVGWGLFFPYFYLQYYVILKGVNPTLAFYSLAILNAASVPGRTIPNLLADKYGHLNALTLTSFGTGVIVFAMFGVHDSAGVIVFSLFYGFFSGAYMSLSSPAIAAFSNDVSEIGIRMGVGFFFMGLASLTGTPIDGALVKNTPPLTWYRGIIFSGVNVLVGATLVLIGRQLYAKKKGTAIV